MTDNGEYSGSSPQEQNVNFGHSEKEHGIKTQDPFSGNPEAVQMPEIECVGVSSHHCGICGEKFSLLTQYINHRVTQHAGQQRTMSCELCGTAYLRQASLMDHYKKKHRVNFSIKAYDKTVPKAADKVNKADDVQTEAGITSDDNHVDGDDSSSKTIHVVITKTADDEEADLSRMDVDMGHEKQEESFNDLKSAENEDLVSSNIMEFVSSAENVEQNKSENVESEMPKSDPKITVNSSDNHAAEDSCTVHTFDEKDDFHFVLLKNIINGNSFKYSKDRFKCLHCEFKSYWRNSICTHMLDMHKDMMSIHQYIEIKPLDSEKPNTDQTIMKMSDYLASLRQKKTLNRSSERRIRNVEKQDLPGHYPCSKCDKEFNRLRYLRKHMLVHKTDKKYLCDECGKAFKTRSYLKTHYRTHKERLYKCSQCNFSSSVNAVIHAHRQLHNDGSVICDVCGFAYADKSTLKKHKLVHDPERPFPCTFPGCTWRFKTKVMCLAHYNAHTSEGKFRCSVCGYVFRHKHHLQRHQNKMHGITNMTNVTIVEEEAKIDKTEEVVSVSDVPDTVNLIVNSDFSRDQLQSALQNGQLVIATDSDGNPINYEVADITMNVTYHTLLEDESALGDTQTILHVATIDNEDNV